MSNLSSWWCAGFASEIFIETMTLHWMDKIFVIVYLTNGSNYVFEVFRFIVLESIWLACIVRGELDVFRRFRPLFELEYLVGWATLQLWFITPTLLTILHGRMNRHVVELIREMKTFYEDNLSSNIEVSLCRSFARKMLAMQVILTCFLISSNWFHMAVVKFDWPLVAVSCIVPCDWFVNIPLLQLLVWICLLRFLYNRVMFDVIKEITRLNRLSGERTPVAQLGEFKKLIGLANVLLSFKRKITKTYENSVMLYLVCCVGLICLFCYNSILEDGKPFISKVFQWLISLFLLFLIPTIITKEVSWLLFVRTSPSQLSSDEKISYISYISEYASPWKTRYIPFIVLFLISVDKYRNSCILPTILINVAFHGKRTHLAGFEFLHSKTIDQKFPVY